MANPAWSAMASGSPDILLAGNQRTYPSDIITTQMDTGPAKMRQRSTAGTIPMSCACMVDATERAEVYAFYTTSCAGGSLVFDITDPFVGGTVEMRWKSPPTETKIASDLYRITLDWEVTP